MYISILSRNLLFEILEALNSRHDNILEICTIIDFLKYLFEMNK